MKKTKSIFLVVKMIKLLLLSFIFGQNISAQSNETGTYTDPRDGKVYKTVKIGQQWMMSQNFAYKPEQGNYWALNNDDANVAKYGYLYDWETAKKIAPPGWHLPTEVEFKTLNHALGGKRNVFKKLGGTLEVVYNQMMPGCSGFNALIAGIRTWDGRFNEDRTDFWSCTASKPGQCFYMLDSKKSGAPHPFFDSDEGTAALANQMNDAKGGKSVRLFKD